MSAELQPGTTTFSPTGNTLALLEAVGHAQSRLHIRACNTGRDSCVISTPSNPASYTDVAMTFTSDGKALVATLGNGIVMLWNTHDTQQQGTILIHEPSGNPTYLAFAPDSQTLAIGDGSGSIRLWAVQSGRLQRTLDGHHGMIYGLSFAPDGATLATACEKNAVQLWRVK